MDLVLKFLEKALTQILLSLLVALASFSYFTGKFPPRKSDLIKAYQLTQTMLTTTFKSNAQMQALSAGGPNLQQMVEFQRLNLKRSEATLELTEIFQRFPQNPPSQKLAEKLQMVSDHLDQAGKNLDEINIELKQLAEGK